MRESEEDKELIEKQVDECLNSDKEFKKEYEVYLLEGNTSHQHNVDTYYVTTRRTLDDYGSYPTYKQWYYGDVKPRLRRGRE